MKVTDYGMRVSPFDNWIRRNSVGVEVGTDVGSHAQAMLHFCNIDFLYLVDIWDGKFYEGYCQGRLHTAGFKNRVSMIRADSHAAVSLVTHSQVNFVYIDITHDYNTVKQSLEDWWPLLAPEGILGYRNYALKNPGLMKAVDEFVAAQKVRIEVINAEIILFKP